jgi:hypothetical protein
MVFNGPLVGLMVRVRVSFVFLFLYFFSKFKIHF